MRLATALVVYFRPAGDLFLPGDPRRPPQRHGAYLLHFDIMCRARALGYEWVRPLGVAPEGDAAHFVGEISVFKRKFGGQELAARAHARLRLRPGRVRALHSMASLESFNPQEGTAVPLSAHTRDVSRAVPGRREPGARLVERWAVRASPEARPREEVTVGAKGIWTGAHNRSETAATYRRRQCS